MEKVIFDDGHHKVIMFYGLEIHDDRGYEAVQTNQFLIIHGDSAIMLDPGGVLTYNELYIRLCHHINPKKLSAIFASHQDPDIISSLSRWLTNSETKVIISKQWARFIPYFCPPGKTVNRIIPLEDQGAWIEIDGAEYGFLPAHFLHSDGNFQLYDPISKILFSGDLCVSLVGIQEVSKPVAFFQEHTKHMEAFHRRYMSSNKICQFWAKMVRRLDIKTIAPQHGVPMMEPEVVQQCIDWIENLYCGIDLIDESVFSLPSTRQKL